MSDEIVAIFGKVSQVRDYASLGLTRIIVDIPVEFHVNATAMLYGKDVLVTMAPASMRGSPYGPRRSNGAEPEKPEDGDDPKGGPLSELAGKWCRTTTFQKWAKMAFPDVARAQPETTSREEIARQCVIFACGIKSRRELDHDDNAKALFDLNIRKPFKSYIVENGL